MLGPLRRSIGMVIARFHFRSARDKMISFRQHISPSARVLLIMPLAPLDDSERAAMLTLFHRHFTEQNITVLTMEQRYKVERVLPRCSVITIAPSEVNAVFLPRRSLMNRLHEREYELAVDLNLDFMLPSGYICRESNAGLRVGFSGVHADTFFNFQVRLDPTSQLGHAYERLVNCLRMFLTAEGV